MAVKVRKYKGERNLQRGLRKMTAQGWRVENQATRKAAFSFLTGFFTRKQIHTVTFVRDQQPQP